MPKYSLVPALGRGLSAVGLTVASFLAFTTTYQVQFDRVHLTLAALCALTFSVLLSLKGRHRLWCLPVLGGFSVYVLWHWRAVGASLREVGNHYIRAFNAYNGGEKHWASTVFSPSDPGMVVLVFVLSLFVCWGVWLLRSALAAALPMGFILCAGTLTNQFPSVPILAAAVFCLALMTATTLLYPQLAAARSRRAKASAWGFYALGLGAMTLIVAVLVQLTPWVSGQFAVHSAGLKRLQASFVRDLPATLLDEVIDPDLALPVKFKPTEFRLNNSPITFSGDEVMEVLADRMPGQTLYLKSESFGSYRGGRWTPLSHASFSRFLALEGGDSSRALGLLPDDPFAGDGYGLTLTRQPGVGEHAPYRCDWPRGALAVADGYLRGLGNPQRFTVYPWSGEEKGEIDSAYEGFVRNEYLTLPQNSQWLADTVGGWEGLSVYEIVGAVYSALRSQARYSMDLTPLPPGADYVEHFLFTQQKGYCQHFASAAVLMLRAAGVPSRFAVGYAVPESFFEETGEGYRAQVTDDLAHAWPEIYLSGVGWLPIEVTPGGVESQLSGPSQTQQPGEESPSPSPSPTAAPDFTPRPTVGPSSGPEAGPSEEGEPSPKLSIGFWCAAAVPAVLLAICLVLYRRRRRIENRRKNQRNPLVLIADLMGMLEFCLGRRQGERSDKEFLLWAFDRAELPEGEFVAAQTDRWVFGGKGAAEDRAGLERVKSIYGSVAQTLRRRLPGPKRLMFDWFYCYNLLSAGIKANK